MESQRVVVVVEEADAARSAVQWAVRHIFRGGDTITLLHVCPPTRSKRKQRHLRRSGFQLALSFMDLCNGIAEAKVEIIVMEGDQGSAVVSVVSKTRASALVVGLHEQSFLYKAAMPSLDCRILAVKHHSATTHDGFTSTEFSQVEITRTTPPTPILSDRRIPYRLCPRCSGIIWRRSKRRR